MSQATAVTADASFKGPASSATFMGHPVGLFVLFFTEMWERFSYYGMRGLLVLYMTKYLFLDGRPDSVVGYSALKHGLEAVFGPLAIQPLSSQIYGLYTALVYLTPLFGGMLADKLLGQRRTVVVGGILMAIGQFMMAMENYFFVAMLFLIIGNGAFKPNISTQVGSLYPPGDERRDRAFTIFYMGINVGAFLSNLVCATLAALYGWRYGFGAAGVGMLLGLVVYIFGQRFLAPDALSQRKDAAAKGVVAEKPAPLTSDEWKRVWALIALCALNVVFWAVYEQQGNTMALWAEENTIWPTILGFKIPSPWFQSFNPMMIFLFAPVLNIFWAWQSRRNKEPSSVIKMALGCLILGLSFVVMVAGAKVIGAGKGNLLWPVGCTAMLTIGELYLSPIGLSLVTKVAPARIVSMMMGMWFLSSFIGNYLAGFIGTYYTRMPKEGFFGMLTILGIIAGVAIWLMNKPLGNAMNAGTPEAPAAEPAPTV
jgi:POT family proton-dependent oligopeptide transporter